MLECHRCGQRFESANPWTCAVEGRGTYGPFCSWACLWAWNDALVIDGEVTP